MNRCTNGTVCSLWTSPDIECNVYKRRRSEKLGHRQRRSKHADSGRVVSGEVRVSYIRLAGSGGTASGPQSGWVATGYRHIIWSLSTGASMHLICCSCHIMLSADTCHLCGIRIRMPAAGICHHFHIFACITGDPVPFPFCWTMSSQQQRCPAWPHVLSLCPPCGQPAPARRTQMQCLSSQRPFPSPSSSDPVCREDWWGAESSNLRHV